MIGLSIKYQGFVPGSPYSRRQLQDALRAGYLAAGRFYFQNVRPKHFTVAGGHEYGYSPRSGDPGNPCPRGFKRSYVALKIRRTGKNIPLMLSGQSMSQTRMATITATSKGVRISMPSGFLTMRPKNSAVNMQREMEAVSLRDQSDIEKIIDRVVEQRLKSLG